jgi:glycosyltransferase involved in cell wall biosynthesis
MKVLFDHPHPFLLAHGGLQIQIERTKAALESIGLEVEFLRWWDADQRGDLIHYFGVPRPSYLEQSHLCRLPAVMTTLFSATCNRPDWKITLQGAIIDWILRLPMGAGVKEQLNWQTYRSCPRILVGLEAERQVAVRAFGAHPSAVSIVPLGLAEAYLKAGPGRRQDDHLICTGTITPVKRIPELALMAKESKVPILFVGKPFHPDDSYWHRFKSLIDGKYVKYHPHVSAIDEMIGLYHGAKGFVLFSQYENWSLSSSEAVACGLPLLLPDRKWSRERFGVQVRYFPGDGHEENIEMLQQFYRDAPSLSPPAIKLWSWSEVAVRLREIYESVVNSSR